LDKGSTHYARELDPASKIDLDKEYKCIDLLNLLRARTFSEMPACYFYDDGKKYEVRISIKEVENGSN
jgi:methionyl-tRNA formyltransferase